MRYELRYFTLNNGEKPFENWLKSLDKTFLRRVQQRLLRAEDGNLGDCKCLDADLSEMRLVFGSGYRIYFTQVEQTIVILLCGGDKSTQSKDIRQANEYIKTLKESNND